ncbi:hypothetical protein PORCAN_1659 [Porphyromonas crevioricanis JCM 13913]|nr:hypothetical protein PORCAN_1659 [Porphyromonas crevioricanis JCM 13913]
MFHYSVFIWASGSIVVLRDFFHVFFMCKARRWDLVVLQKYVCLLG